MIAVKRTLLNETYTVHPVVAYVCLFVEVHVYIVWSAVSK